MEERVGIYFKKINDLIEKHINNSLKEYNITLSQGRVLSYLQRNKDRNVSQKEIEKHFNITHVTVSGIITRLEHNGFIKVDRDKRINRITLLKKSYENEKVIKKHQDEIESYLCKGFTDKEKEQFIKKLKTIYETLKESEVNA